MKDRRLELRLTSEEETAYATEAAEAALSVSAWLRRAGNEAVELASALRQQREAEEKQAAFYQSLKRS